jgi:hypothetical protein
MGKSPDGNATAFKAVAKQKLKKKEYFYYKMKKMKIKR